MLFYLALLIVPMLLGLYAQHKVQSTFRRYSEVPEDTGLTGQQVARQILDHNGLQSVPVEAVPGSLTDHYDPRTRSVHLSEEVYGRSTVSAIAVAAHEVGHAIQHARAYRPMQLRSALWPVTAFASQAWMFMLMGGFVLAAMQMSGIGIPIALGGVILYGAVVLFQIVTLPVEFDASRRAAIQLKELGIANPDEALGVKKVLQGAALTYIAGALAALSQLVYFLFLLLGRR